jgi:Zn finger protein HypA/HybF involved in hydrogenase expression
MSNYADCPKCGTEIDAVAASLTGYCPECDTPFAELLDIAADDYEPPEIDYGPPEGHR